MTETRSILSNLAVYGAVALSLAGCSSPSPEEMPDPRRGEVTWDATLVPFESCEALESSLEAMLIADLDADLDRYFSDERPIEVDDLPPTPPPWPRPEPLPPNGLNYATNRAPTGDPGQADFVVLDDGAMYLLDGNRVHVFAVSEAGDLAAISSIDLEGFPEEMLLDRDAGKLVVLFVESRLSELPLEHPLRPHLRVSVNAQERWRINYISKLTVIDISDRAAPAVERELYFEGGYEAASLVDGRVHLSMWPWMNLPLLPMAYRFYDQHRDDRPRAEAAMRSSVQALTLPEMTARVYERLPGGEVQVHDTAQGGCQSFYRADNSQGRHVTSIYSLDLGADQLALESDHVVGGRAEIRGQGSRVHIAQETHDAGWFWWNPDHPDQTDIHSFDVGAPAGSRYLGSARLEGVVLYRDMFTEYQGDLYVAAVNRPWSRWESYPEREVPAAPETHLSVLRPENGTLVEIGQVDGIAPDGASNGVRLIGAEGGVMAYARAGQVGTLDISDPSDPRLLGETTLPRFAARLELLARDALLTLDIYPGMVDEWAVDIGVRDIGDIAASSVAYEEHLTMTTDWLGLQARFMQPRIPDGQSRELLAMPMAGYRPIEGETDRWEYTSTLHLYDVDPEAGITSLGVIDHSDLYNADPARYWYYRDIRRVMVVGDYLYAISDAGVTVHALADPGTVIDQELLPGHSLGDGFWR